MAISTEQESNGVGHHVALSIVGADRLPESGYLRGKMAQEKLIKASKVPYTIVRSTQFFEFLGGIAQSGTDGQTIRLSPALVQPIASDDVAAAMADATLGAPVNGTVEVAGPERVPLAELVQRFLSAKQDARKVITDVHSRYFGAELNDQSLVPGDNARIGLTSFEAWIQSNPQSKPAKLGKRRIKQCPRRGDELRVHLSMLFRRIRLLIRD